MALMWKVRSVRVSVWLGVLAGVMLPALATRPAMGQSAGTWMKRGAAAEASEDYDAAYEDYKKAFQKDPADLRTKANYERLRFMAGAMHVDKGRTLRKAGDTNGALTEYLRALQIDPGNQTAQQEIEQIRQNMMTPSANQAEQQAECDSGACGVEAGFD
jgi:general secretion pathway protein D